MYQQNVAIVDADLIGKKKNRFPNLACMKLSGYNKMRGHHVVLKTDYEDLGKYDSVYISKVFTDTQVPESILHMPNVQYGGTGFFYSQAPRLKWEIEHHPPDYDLYKDFVLDRISTEINSNGGEWEKDLYRKTRNEYKWYLDYSIGFLTRGCFRHCDFCVNKDYNKVSAASPLGEFFDRNRPKLCFLDDNFLGYTKWKDLLEEVYMTGRPFTFRQGLDIRLMTEEKFDWLMRCKYDGDCTFAFDDVNDYGIIRNKLEMIRCRTDKQFRFYVLVGFKGQDGADIEDAFIRIALLMRYGCLPYIMRHEKCKESRWKGVYTTLARWCNQPSFYKKMSFREFCEANGETSATLRYMREFEAMHPHIARTYFDIRYGEEN